MMDETNWVSAHMFHQGALDTLLLKAVFPLAAGLKEEGLVRDWFFLRHWEGGLHVRLRLLPRDAEAAEPVRARVLEHAGHFFTQHPSRARLTDEEYLVHAEKLARWEGTTEFPRTLAPNDSVAFVPYRREHGKYGQGATMEAAERHFCESSQLARTLLEAAPGPEARDTAAFSFILLAWFLCEASPSRLLPHVAARAHPPDPPRGTPALWRAAIEQRYRKQQDRLATLAEQLRELVARLPELPESGTLVLWARSVARLREVLEAAVAAGQFPPAGEPGPAAVLRVSDICAHLICNRLGVDLTGESYVRMLAARTVGRLAGVKL